MSPGEDATYVQYIHTVYSTTDVLPSSAPSALTCLLSLACHRARRLIRQLSRRVTASLLREHCEFAHSAAKSSVVPAAARRRRFSGSKGVSFGRATRAALS